MGTCFELPCMRVEKLHWNEVSAHMTTTFLAWGHGVLRAASFLYEAAQTVSSSAELVLFVGSKPGVSQDKCLFHGDS